MPSIMFDTGHKDSNASDETPENLVEIIENFVIQVKLASGKSNARDAGSSRERSVSDTSFPR